MIHFFERFKQKNKPPETLKNFWDVSHVDEEGVLYKKDRQGFVFEIKGIDSSMITPGQMTKLHHEWRAALNFMPGEEVQFIFQKRVRFSKWIENQLERAFLAENMYGRKILLDRLSEQLSQMSEDKPSLLNPVILICFWTNELLDSAAIKDKSLNIASQISSFGLPTKRLDRDSIEKSILWSSADLKSCESADLNLPSVKITPDHLEVNEDQFRALQLSKLPEHFSELGMIQSITKLPYPLDVVIRLKAKDVSPIISKLERKRNLLSGKSSRKNSPSPELETQMKQIDEVLESLTSTSESIFDMQMTVGLRFPKKHASFLRNALSVILRSAYQMNFCEFEESTLGTFDNYLETIPSFKGKNITTHTVLGSNAVHFLPMFMPSVGDKKAIINFQTREASIYSIDPTDPHLANYNWLVSGTSGSGKSFFVNSLLAQSSSINPNIFIVDIGGSYNKLTQFMGGRVMSLEPGQGFELSPFFLSKKTDPSEERLRKQHIFQIFLEMTRVDGQLPGIELRHLLSEQLDVLFEMEKLPKHPISFLIDLLSKNSTPHTDRLVMLLNPWKKGNFFGEFLDNDKSVMREENILTFDLKGLTDFEDLSRVVQLIVCASLWAKVREAKNGRFSWVILDEVAFSLLKTQALFVDELVSTLRKYFAGAVIIVQDLEKVTSNLAGSSILQNTNSKAILQQRGSPKNYSEYLSLTQIDQWAIESLQSRKGSFSEALLIRNEDKVVVRHLPSSLEYWLATSAPEDRQTYEEWANKQQGDFQKNIINFSKYRKGVM